MSDPKKEQKKDLDQPILPSGLNPESDIPPDADIEERFNDFWKKNGAGIFGGIAIGALVVVGIQLFQYFDEKKEAALRDAFAETTTTEAKLQFAEEHAEHQLGALAQLQVADARYNEGNFQAAADNYSLAARGFMDPTLSSRALVGQGVSLLRAGSTEAGQSVLEAVALDPSALDVTRGEAAYHLAVSYWEVGDTERVSEVTDIILELEAPYWVFRANSLRERLGVEAAS